MIKSGEETQLERCWYGDKKQEWLLYTVCVEKNIDYDKKNQNGGQR